MLLKSVIGNNYTKEHLTNIARNDMIPHAILFHSAPGAGGLAMALAFSQYLQCLNPSESDSCGLCSACVKAQKLIHPDIHFTFPVISTKSGSPPKSNDFLTEFRKFAIDRPYDSDFDWIQSLTSENKQGNITAEETRYILQQLNFKAYEGKYKIQIIWMAEYLKKEGNILLKLIEEPPPKTILILIAENLEEILPTVLSRTQLIKIEALSDDEIAEALINRGIDQQEAIKIAYLSNGDFSKALYLSKNKEEDYTLLFTEWMRYILTLQKSSGALLKWCDKIHGLGRERIKDFIDYALHFFEQTLLMKYMPQKTPRLTNEELKVATHIQNFIEISNLEAIAELLEDLRYSIERNAFAKVQMLSSSLNLKYILQNKKQ
jgi:DNA polymerase-3 subunit delta'